MAHHDIIAPIRTFSVPMPKPVTFLLAVVSLYTQRRTLSKLSEAALADIGVTRAQADAEAARPLWDAPSGYYSSQY